MRGNIRSLGGYESNSILVYEEGYNKLYQNGIYTAEVKSMYIINAKCSVVMKPERTSDGVTLQVLVNGEVRDSKEVKTGSTDFSEYPGDIISILPLNYGDKVEIYCKTPQSGYITSDSSKNTLSIVGIRT
jgi:hypothetical protein